MAQVEDDPQALQRIEIESRKANLREQVFTGEYITVIRAHTEMLIDVLKGNKIDSECLGAVSETLPFDSSQDFSFRGFILNWNYQEDWLRRNKKYQNQALEYLFRSFSVDPSRDVREKKEAVFRKAFFYEIAREQLIK